jgi:hypothetical protein
LKSVLGTGSADHKNCNIPSSIRGRTGRTAGRRLGRDDAKVLHHAEFRPLPANGLLQQVLSASTLDSTVLAAGQTRTGPHASTLTSSLFAGQPRDGGYGVLPICSHMRAHHAKWGVALLLSHRPWARTLRALLVRAGLAPPLVEAHPLARLELAANIVRPLARTAALQSLRCNYCSSGGGGHLGGAAVAGSSCIPKVTRPRARDERRPRIAAPQAGRPGAGRPEHEHARVVRLRDEEEGRPRRRHIGASC